jgi:serine protease Do
MRTKLFTQTAASALVAGLVLASGVGAQERPRPQAGGASRDVGAWLSGFGTSIGASVRDASTAEIAAAGLSQPGGAFVIEVTAGQPAAQAGLMGGDVVTEFDGERVRSAQHLVRLVRESAAGRAVRVTVVRDRARRTVDLTPGDVTSAIADLPEIGRQVERATRELTRDLSRLRVDIDGEGLRRSIQLSDRRRFGAELMPLSTQLATYFGVKEGLLVAGVQDDSPASRAGVRAGDVVLTVNGSSMREVDDFVNEISRTESALTLTVMRDKKEVTLKATLPERVSRVRARGRPV